MKIIIALDSFKGSCSAHAACAAVARGIRRVCPDAELVELPLSDGGEGLIATLSDSGPLRHASKLSCTCTGPYGGTTEASYLLLPGGRAVLEMAQSCGLELTPPARRDVRYASSYGLGEQVKSALDAGACDIVIGLGGSATNDGGLGFAQALGATFWLQDGSLLSRPGCADDLARLDRVDISTLDARLQNVHITASCDVTNPLLGERGATWVYGPQKGATKTTLAELEAGMAHYARLMTQATGKNVAPQAGAGAAGGMGAALLWYCDATLSPGIELVMDLLDTRKHLQEATLVLVGEGRMDSQSAWGKAPVGMATRAAEYQLPVIALCGGRDDSSRLLYKHAITAMWSLCPRPMSLEEAMSNSENLLADTAENTLRTFLAGMLSRTLPIYSNNRQPG
jgi:glycerate kinase